MSGAAPIRPPTLSVGALFTQIASADPVFLLGAGASVRSGIPASGDLVRLAMRWLFATQQGWTSDDPNITNSDVHSLLLKQPWYRTDADLAEFLPKALEALQHPRELRREFLLEVLNRVAPPSVGYQRLADLLRARRVRTVLTTNFDDLLPLAFGRGGLVTIADREEFGSISTNPSRPQVIYLHGKAEHYLDRILDEEIARLDSALSSRLLPLLSDHPVVVIGYRGSEPSVMRDLFLDRVAAANGFRRGVFWCVRDTGEAAVEHLHPLAREMAMALAPNFTLVPGVDFDGLLTELADLWRQRSSSVPTLGREDNASVQSLPFELRTSNVTPDGLDWTAITARLGTYARRMELPAGADGDWAQQFAASVGLLRKADAGTRLTNVGAMLFTDARIVAPGAWIEFRRPNRPPEAIDGGLFEQYEKILVALAELNRPIRMKGTRSESVHPYPEAALKEVIANALIHRDYLHPAAIEITVANDSLTIASPGGLEPDLRRRLLRSQPAPETPPDLLQRALELGERGAELTGYRNRVLADLFYGTGLVDKAGSGLADALQQLEAVGGRLRTEVAPDNSAFTVTLVRRPARVDTRTATAQPEEATLTLQLNALQITALPSTIWSAPTVLRPGALRGPDFRALPPHVLYDGRVFTFSNLGDLDNPLRGYAELPLITSVEREAWIGDPNLERRLVHLIDEAIFRHLGSLGLAVEWNDKLAYYACRNQVARYAEYRSRARLKQRRRVAHWPGESRRYCEHKAARFHVERPGSAWLLSIVPTYVFTRDGGHDRITGPEAASLATSASTEDYNLKVLFDFVFWGSILSSGKPLVRIDAGPGAAIEIVTQAITAEVAPLPRSFRTLSGS